jgi:hypothetical protein
MIVLDKRCRGVGNFPTSIGYLQEAPMPTLLHSMLGQRPEPFQDTVPTLAASAPRAPVRTSERPRIGVLSVFVVTALCSVLLVALGGCGGGGGTDTAATPPAEPRAQGLAASRSGDLLGQAQRLLRERAANSAGSGTGDGGRFIGLPGPTTTTVAAGVVTASYSNTLVQEVGVDEADLLKTDGTHLYSVSRSASGQLTMAVHRRGTDGRVSLVASLPLPSEQNADVAGQGLMLTGDGRAAAVVTRRWLPAPVPDACADLCPPQPMVLIGNPTVGHTEVQRVALDNGRPTAGDRLRIEGSLVDSRRVGDRLVLVTQHRPVLAPDLLPNTATPAEREAAIARVSAADLLPKFTLNEGAARPLLSETDCWVQPANASKQIQLTTITVVNLASAGLERTSRCFIGGSEALYMTPSSLYIATTRWSYAQDAARGWVFPSDIRTDLHKFAFDAVTGALSYRASADVPGHLGWDPTRKSWRLSEHEGVLRVLTFTGPLGWVAEADASGPNAKPASPATLTLLRESGGAMQVVATLPNAQRPAALGKPGEQVYGVRFVGSQGFVVTFRRIDPLYVLDLANPADPRIAGELELPGFSDHLVPLGSGLLFAVGRDATAQGVVTGVKVALIDVSNPAAPRERASQILGGVGSYSALDFARHGLNAMTVNGTVRLALPYMNWIAGTPDWTDSLLRWEVDLARGTLVERARLSERTGSEYPDLAMQRSLQIGNHVYHLRGGQLLAEGW